MSVRRDPLVDCRSFYVVDTVAADHVMCCRVNRIQSRTHRGSTHDKLACVLCYRIKQLVSSLTDKLLVDAFPQVVLYVIRTA